VLLPVNGGVLKTILRHVESADLRKQAFVLANRHTDEALKILHMLLHKRDQLAKMMELPSYAALSLTTRLAKNPSNVHRFLDDLSRLVKRKAEKVRSFWLSLPLPL